MHSIYYSYPSQVLLPPNGQLQAYGLPPGQGFPGMMPPIGHALPGQPLPGSTGHSGFPGGFPTHHTAQQQQQQVPLKSLSSQKWNVYLVLDLQNCAEFYTGGIVYTYSKINDGE